MLTCLQRYVYEYKKYIILVGSQHNWSKMFKDQCKRWIMVLAYVIWSLEFWCTQNLRRKKIVNGMLSINHPNQSYLACLFGKYTRASFPKEITTREIKFCHCNLFILLCVAQSILFHLIKKKSVFYLIFLILVGRLKFTFWSINLKFLQHSKISKFL